MKYLSFAVLFLISMHIPLAFCQADDFVIATIDMDRILNESKAAQARRKELDTISTQKKKSIEAKKGQLESLEEKLKSEKTSDDSKESEQFRAQARDFSRMVKDAEEDLKKQYIKTTKELLADAQKKIESYAKANNISLVLEKGKRQIGGPVLFGSSGMDITDKIIADLNNG